MEQVVLILHVLTAIAIIALILLQQGKGADMGASFGGGSSQTLFGSSGGGNVLTKSTAILATLFFVTSFGLAIIAKQKSTNVGVDIGIPSVVETINQAADDLPVAEEGIPAVNEAIPSLDVDIPAVPDDNASDIPAIVEDAVRNAAEDIPQ